MVSSSYVTSDRINFLIYIQCSKEHNIQLFSLIFYNNNNSQEFTFNESFRLGIGGGAGEGETKSYPKICETKTKRYDFYFQLPLVEM